MIRAPAWEGRDPTAFFAAFPVSRIGRSVQASRLVALLNSDGSTYDTGEFRIDGSLFTRPY
ncbi:hypothetical protein ACU686_16585 [Yinghuangia aomiensis]